ncbi:ABC transporter family substrate-binding protein [Corynebacterium tapiri]|uniref:ABC transporter family substrate-binding protein n=2 Tax=Corynebacterium tapiri TaxID=1448266 RepID=A0A5C4U6U5_9CORY|nr:ABC transporter family substrate-binding protein [Corynebacterium tapiri]
MANPGPPPTVEPEAPTTSSSPVPTTTPTSSRTQVSVGIDPLRNGLNPHLIADNQAVVDAIADLTLPSAFRNGELNEDLLVSAVEVPPSSANVVQTVRYELRPEAQWSDGTPITGADFLYLWQAMTSTPGVVDPSGYRAISAVDQAEGGRVITVDFSQRVESWRELFTHLLPSHLAEPEGKAFATTFYSELPASAGRFMVQSVDRSRGMILLHRNDRFWGKDPAKYDVLRLNFVTSVTEGVDQLRNGQISFLDVTPAETSAEAYRLLPGAQTQVVDTPRRLNLDVNVASEALSTPERRNALFSLLDVSLIARQAAGRSSDVVVPPQVSYQPFAAIEDLRKTTQESPLRIGADPADEQGTSAVRAITDSLTRQGIKAEAVATDVPTAARRELPGGNLDAYVSWDVDDSSAQDLASRYQCPPVATGQTQHVRLSNLTGYCAPDAEELSASILSGARGQSEANDVVRGLNAAQALTLPLMTERRVVVLGEGIIGPSPDLNQWAEGLSSAGSWSIKER